MSERSLAIGVAYVGYGAYPGIGAPATDYTQVKDVFKGTLVFNFSDANQVKIETEGRGTPRWILNRKGDADSFEFAIPSPTVDDLIAFCGGTKNGEKWEAPDNVPDINMSLKIQSEPYGGKYTEYVMVNGSVFGKLSQAPGAEQSDLLLVKVVRQQASSASGDLRPSFTREVKDVAAIPVTTVTVNGTPKVGTALAAVPTPALATGVYQWQKKTGSETAIEIAGAANQVYVPTASDVGAKISVKFIASGSYSGTVTSAEGVAVVA